MIFLCLAIFITFQSAVSFLHFIMTDLLAPAYLAKESANSRQVEII